MAFNIPKQDSESSVSTAIVNQINVDGVNLKVLPTGQDPNVVYRIGDGTTHPEGWDNVTGQKYLDFYLSRGIVEGVSSTGSGGGQFLGYAPGVKGLQYMAQSTAQNEYLVVGENQNLFAIDSITIEEGTELVIPDGSVFKVL